MDLQKYNIFPEFRKNQEELIRSLIKKVLYSPNKYTILELGTGVGKSLIAYVAAKYLADNYKTKIQNYKEDYPERTDRFSTYLLTSKNLLLDQYVRDFKEYLAVIKGGDNYKCLLNKLSYKQGICHLAKRKLECEKACPYKLARFYARRNPITLSNFHYMLVETEYVRKMGKRDLCWIDEAHAMEQVLIDYRTVQFTETNIKLINTALDVIQNCNYKIESQLFLVANEHYEGSYERYNPEIFKTEDLEYIENLLTDIKDRINYIEDALEIGVGAVQEYDESGNPIENKDVLFATDLIDKLGDLRCKISNYFKSRHSTTWVVQEHKTDVGNKITGFELKPIDVKFLVKDIFENMADKIVMMSATIGNKDRFCKNLGIDPNNCDFISLPSDFPIENRPFYVAPIANINNGNIERALPVITQFVDSMLDQFPNKKGIIHSVSFKNADYILLNSKHRDRLLTHDEKNKDQIIDEFKKSDNKVLVSPSIIEGFDFKGGLSEFQLFIKVPYMSLGDKATVKRMEEDPEWYAYNAVISIVQGVGRSIRSNTDQAITFCIDGNIKNLIKRYGYLFGEDFLKTVEYINE